MSIWAQGFSLDLERSDAIHCSPGNVPCGERCLPRGQKCGGADKFNRGRAIAIGAAVATGGLLAAGGLVAARKRLKAVSRSSRAVTPNNAQVDRLSQDLQDLINENTNTSEPFVRPSGAGAAAPQSRKPRRPRPMRRKKR